MCRGVVQTGLTKPTAGRDKFLETTALGRIAQPIEIGRAILFLLSDQSSFVTGSVSYYRIYFEALLTPN